MSDPIDDAPETGADEPRFSVTLPGRWDYVPLLEPEATRAAIHRLVRRAVGPRDDAATARQLLTRRFDDAVAAARTIGGQQMHLCHEVMPGLPLPASLVIVWPGIVVPRAESLDDAALRAELATLIGPAGDDDELVFDVGSRPAIRRASIHRGEPDVHGEADREIETLEVRIHAIAPNNRVIVLSFSCGVPQLREDLVPLFDLIASSLRWDEPGAAAH